MVCLPGLTAERQGQPAKALLSRYWASSQHQPPCFRASSLLLPAPEPLTARACEEETDSGRRTRSPSKLLGKPGGNQERFITVIRCLGALRRKGASRGLPAWPGCFTPRWHFSQCRPRRGGGHIGQGVCWQGQRLKVGSGKGEEFTGRKVGQSGADYKGLVHQAKSLQTAGNQP